VLVPVVAWLVAQILKKFWVQAYRDSSFKDLSFFFRSGSMPSSHAAIAISLLTTIGIKEGIDSSAFGIAFVLCTIVLYDAVNVRRSVGEQGAVVAELAKKAGLQIKFHSALGHRVPEVVVGALVGAAVSLVMLQFI